MNARELLEDAMAAKLVELQTAGMLKKALAIGGMDWLVVLKGALATSPFALVKYQAKQVTLNDTVLECQASVSVLYGAVSHKDLKTRRVSIYDLLQAGEEKLMGLRPHPAFYGLELIGEQWSEVSGGGLEVWTQDWLARWEEDAKPYYGGA